MFDFANQHLRLWPVQLNYNMICNQSFSVQIWKQQKNVECFTILRVILALRGFQFSLRIGAMGILKHLKHDWNKFETSFFVSPQGVLKFAFNSNFETDFFV